MNKKVDEEFVGIKDCYFLQCLCTEMKEKIINLQKENERLKQFYVKKGIYSLEYDKETLATMVIELQKFIDDLGIGWSNDKI